MALGANFHFDVFLGGTGFDHITTSTGDGGVVIVRMNSLFQIDTPQTLLILHHLCGGKNFAEGLWS